MDTLIYSKERRNMNLHICSRVLEDHKTLNISYIIIYI